MLGCGCAPRDPMPALALLAAAKGNSTNMQAMTAVQCLVRQSCCTGSAEPDVVPGSGGGMCSGLLATSRSTQLRAAHVRSLCFLRVQFALESRVQSRQLYKIPTNMKQRPPAHAFRRVTALGQTLPGDPRVLARPGLASSAAHTDIPAFEFSETAPV